MIKKMGFYLMSLYVIVGMASPANSDWFYDFEEPLPLSFITAGLRLDGTLSPTFSASIDGGFLTLADPIPAEQGGAYRAYGAVWRIGEKFTDVRITGTLNVARTTENDLALLARGDIPTLSTYTAYMDFWTGGYLAIQKIVNGSEVDFVRSSDPDQGSQRPLTYNGRSFFLQFDVVGNLLSARLFNHEGGRQLLVAHYTDTGTSGPPIASGASGLGVAAYYTSQPINSTFDDVASIAISDTIINGRVTSTDGIPLKALVMVTNLKMTVVRWAAADVAGGYSVPDLEEGVYLVLAFRIGYELGVHMAWVRTGKASTVIFTLVPRD